MDSAALARALRQQALLPILRMDDQARCLGLARALAGNGFGLLEITLDTPGALESIATLAQEGVAIGAGTVLTAAEAEAAIEAGAEFLVSPGLGADVAAVAAQAHVAYLPGVLTPSEVTQASALNLDVLKLFPAQVFGPAYLKQIKGPFRRAQWLVTGGVELDQWPLWRAAGAMCFGYGPRLVSAVALAAGDWKVIAAELQSVRRRLDQAE